MEHSKPEEIQAIVQHILNDSSAYQELGARLQSMSGDEQAKLISALRSENPPLLGTGPVS